MFALFAFPLFLKVLGEEDVNFFAAGKERAGGGRFCKSALLLLPLFLPNKSKFEILDTAKDGGTLP